MCFPSPPIQTEDLGIRRGDGFELIGRAAHGRTARLFAVMTIMNLPNYFLADLPPEATLSPAMITEACQTLKHNRERYLATRSTESLIKTLSSVAEAGWSRTMPFRKFALEQGPAQTGFSRETLARGLDNFFGQFTRENFHALARAGTRRRQTA